MTDPYNARDELGRLVHYTQNKGTPFATMTQEEFEQRAAILLQRSGEYLLSSCDMAKEFCEVYDWSTDMVHLSMGGDLSVTVGMTAEAAQLLAHALTTAVSRLP